MTAEGLRGAGDVRSYGVRVLASVVVGTRCIRRHARRRESSTVAAGEQQHFRMALERIRQTNPTLDSATGGGYRLRADHAAGVNSAIR